MEVVTIANKNMETSLVDKSKNRKSGFYWIKYNGSWLVGEWNSFDEDLGFGWGDWYIASYDRSLDDSRFEEIDERQIIRSDKK
jgi:hypothetical protein